MKTKFLHIMLTAIGLLLITKMVTTFMSFRQGVADKWNDTHMRASASDTTSSKKARQVEAKIPVDSKGASRLTKTKEGGRSKNSLETENKQDVQELDEKDAQDAQKTSDTKEVDVKDFMQKNRTNLGTQEVLLLNALMRMQQDMEQRQQAMDNKTKVLEATKKSVEQQVAQLQELRAQIDGIVNKQQAGHEQQIQSLVKVYENMRPKEAALIFNQMEVAVLVELIKYMKEAKVAAILSYMNPMKARDLSIRLIDNQDKALDKKNAKVAQPLEN
ncbi:putative flagellar motility protein MotE [Rickettsiales endosymbiont of Paramecium tredecaurelia]|uniref:MotE family protein n=1 Tax=Candidatus Sarmatiella mevalonica TaxID=2770581 RepID=UPI001920DC34|nr:hypothetical protein [Candidatus Sarmatiella mevalonica]MBL3284752.1 putative flagellar motility protein MotE [Candidatus Sarmatiella mevalonica]